MESIAEQKDEFLKKSAKVEISDEELHETREKVIREFVKEKGWKLD